MSGSQATNKVLWGGEYVYCCDSHLVGFVNLGNVLGVAVEYEKYRGDEECSNCNNRRKEEDDKP